VSSDGPSLASLTFGASGQSAEQAREGQEPDLVDSTWLAHSAAGVYAEILGERRQLEAKLAQLEQRVEREGLGSLTAAELDLYHAGASRRTSTFL
jgi:hypothetical protein